MNRAKSEELAEVLEKAQQEWLEERKHADMSDNELWLQYARDFTPDERKYHCLKSLTKRRWNLQQGRKGYYQVQDLRKKLGVEKGETLLAYYRKTQVHAKQTLDREFRLTMELTTGRRMEHTATHGRRGPEAGMGR